MSDFPYDSIADFQKWTIVSEATDRSTIIPQGAAPWRLPRDVPVASAGSCFAQQIAKRLPRYGVNYLVTEAGAEPYSARYGNIYTARQLSQLLRRAYGDFVPLERAWYKESGVYVDPFRPFAIPHGFDRVDELERDRERHFAAVRALFERAGLFIVTLGLTESWYDRRDGAVFPACPGRDLGTFDSERYEFAAASVDETVADLEEFLQGLARVNTTARVILTVSPVAIAATMLPVHIIRASVLTKSILKVAAETVAGRNENTDYFAAYDWVTINPGQERLVSDDGRHMSPRVADYAVEMLVSHYFEPEQRSAGRPVPVETGAECDEDRLLALISRGAQTARRSVSRDRPAVERPTPLYFIGDSTSVVYRNALYGDDDSSERFIGHGLHVRRLHAQDLADDGGRLNPSVLKALVVSEIISERTDRGFAVNTIYDRAFGDGGRRSFPLPAVTICCGHLDVGVLMNGEFADCAIDLPDAIRPRSYPGRYPGDIPFHVALSAAEQHLTGFERGLHLLRSYGIESLAVHMIAPSAPLHSLLHFGREADTFALYQGLTIVVNHALRAICDRADVLFLDFSSRVTLPNGIRDPQYSLDAIHLNEAASAIAVPALVAGLRARSSTHGS